MPNEDVQCSIDLGTVNLVPSPKILRVLGRIEFENWQCLAELIDNAIDAIHDFGGHGNIGVITPSKKEFDNDPAATVRVWDDGPGMSIEQIEKALKAGYSGNDPVSRLGLFGMGFNIATARLGRTSEVRTTRKGDKYWHSVVIDFKEMEKAGNYIRPIRGVVEKANPDIHGTQVIVSGLYERVRTIRLQTKIKETLSRIYSPIILENKIQITIDGDALRSRGFCSWGGERYVERDGEKIYARIDIDKNVGKEYYCTNCWEWIDSIDKPEDLSTIVCPHCHEPVKIEVKEKRIKGWLGVQRFYDEENYGIDLVRNGRVIEPLSKDLFFWKNPDTDEKVKEYVLDATHWGGRIIGELHIDFVPLSSYQKDHFEKADNRWKEVEHYIRGKGPLRAKYAKTHDHPENKSPLGIIYKGYRKGNDPGKGDLLPGDENGKGVNSTPKLWAKKFFDGDPEYQNDTKWYDLVLLAETSKRSSGGAPVSMPVPGSDGVTSIITTDVSTISGGTTTSGSGTPGETSVLNFEKDPYLSQEYDLEDLKEPPIDITVNRVISGCFEDVPVKLEIKAKDKFIVTYNPKHQLFNSYNLEPLDLILIELSQTLSKRKDDPKEWSTSKIFWFLKRKYSGDKKLSPKELADKSNELIASIKRYIGGRDLPLPVNITNEPVINEVRKNVLSRRGGGENEVSMILKTTKYIAFAPDEEILNVFQVMPHVFLDGNYWKRPFETLGTDQLKQEVTRTFSSYLNDLLWLNQEARDYDPDMISEDIEFKLQRASLSLKLLEIYRE
jgi:DNA-directed RNA polymerase subunit RPC12/RpoP